MEPCTHHCFVELFCQATEVGVKETVDKIQSILRNNPPIFTSQSQPKALNIDYTFA